MTEKKPGEPDDPVLAKRYAALDDYGKKLVHEIGALVLDAHAAGKREGAREALDAIKIHGVPLIQQLAGSAAAVASEINCFSEKERCSEDDRCEYHTVQEELSRNFSHIFELAIRALADQPEAEGQGVTARPMTNEQMARFILKCPRVESVDEFLDAEPQIPAKADTLPLGHEFEADDLPLWPGRKSIKCRFCFQPEAAHGRKPE